MLLGHEIPAIILLAGTVPSSPYKRDFHFRSSFCKTSKREQAATEEVHYRTFSANTGALKKTVVVEQPIMYSASRPMTRYRRRPISKRRYNNRGRYRLTRSIRGIGSKALKFMKLQGTGTIGTNNAGQIFINYVNIPTGLQDWASCTNLFDSYRVYGMKFKWVPRFPDGGGQNGTIAMGQIYCIYDCDTINPVSTTTSPGFMVAYENCKEYSVGKDWSYYAKVDEVTCIAPMPATKELLSTNIGGFVSSGFTPAPGSDLAAVTVVPTRDPIVYETVTMPGIDMDFNLRGTAAVAQEETGPLGGTTTASALLGTGQLVILKGGYIDTNTPAGYGTLAIYGESLAANTVYGTMTLTMYCGFKNRK